MSLLRAVYPSLKMLLHASSLERPRYGSFYIHPVVYFQCFKVMICYTRYRLGSWSITPPDQVNHHDQFVVEGRPS
mgnify:CR=1 FL=1